VLADPERAPDEVGARTAPAERLEAREDRVVRAGLELGTPRVAGFAWPGRRVRSEDSIRRGSLRHAELVVLAEPKASRHGFERGATHAEVATGRHLQDLRSHELRRDLAEAPARGVAQRAEGLFEGERGAFVHREP